ncbi:helix-turn-helix domain-containing protein [Phyllobacterium sp. SB3]|uniref:helix-turn-helix transcriptional regulator n=1 Tax=Phyllobacterium sp. SB3 TaxID=3156073 RepID=UPI0032AEB6EB
MTPTQKIALTIPEAIDYSGIGRSSLYKLFSEGKITRRKRGKSVLIIREELDRFILNLPTAV